MTITRRFGTKFIPSYIAGTIVEVIHFRDMIFATDDMVAIYLDTANASMDLASFNIAKFPEFEGDESDTEKVLLLNKSEAQSNKIGLKILKRKDNTGVWNEAAEIILVNRGRKDYLDLRSYTGYPTRIMEKNDAIAIQLVDYGDGLLWDTDFISIDFGCTVEIKKKDDLTELTNRLAALESLLGLFGAATASVAGTNGLVKGANIGEQGHLLRGDRTWQNPSAFAKFPINLTTDVLNTLSIANGGNGIGSYGAILPHIAYDSIDFNQTSLPAGIIWIRYHGTVSNGPFVTNSENQGFLLTLFLGGDLDSNAYRLQVLLCYSTAKIGQIWIRKKEGSFGNWVKLA